MRLPALEVVLYPKTKQCRGPEAQTFYSCGEVFPDSSMQHAMLIAAFMMARQLQSATNLECLQGKGNAG